MPTRGAAKTKTGADQQAMLDKGIEVVQKGHRTEA